MKRILLIVFLLASLFAASFSFSNVHAADAIGRITLDTTWDKGNSPYNLNGSVNVNTVVTLTIEPGVRVNLNGYYMQVEGTLQAKGISSDQIQFNNGSIKFTQDGSGWNEQSRTGCIIQNANLNSVSVTNIFNAVKLDHDSIRGDVSVAGASIVTSNIIVGSVYTAGPTLVWENTITGSVSGGCTSVSYPIISSNTILKGSNYLKTGISSSGYALIVDNTIFDCNYGVYLYSSPQQFGESIAPNAVLERNKITNNNEGIHMEIYSAMVNGNINPSITNNTISQNNLGVSIYGEAQYLALENNNIQDNSNYSIRFGSGVRSDLNATYNWWGSTDNASIDQTIYDSNSDFNLGTVNFQPFLTNANTLAVPDPNMPIPTLSPLNSVTPTPITQPTVTPMSETTYTPVPSKSPNQTGSQTSIFGGVNGFELGILIAVIAIIVLVVVLIALVLKRRGTKQG